MYENTPLLISANGLNGYAPVSVYAYIIRGELTDENNNKVTRYWRVNLAKETKLNGNEVAVYQILRNSLYNVKIGTVRTVGYATPKDAEEEKPIIPDAGEAGVDVTITVSPWREFNEPTDI
ncbi:MAG: fimbria major subunit [Tannerellaceae bacterium]|nr:fimbria major subunit [Tannerellaceae bacterium]